MVSQLILISASALLGLIGYHFKDKSNYKHPWLGKLVSPLIVLVWIISMYKVFSDGTDKAQLKESVNSLQSQVATLQTANDTLKNTLTGGTGFCYVEFPRDTKQNGGTPVVINKGSFSLYGIHARFVDMSKAKQTGTISPQDAALDITELFGDRVASFTSGMVPFTNPTAQDFNVFFTARNGSWTQLVRLRWIGGIWLHAIRVFMDTPQGIGHQTKPIFESISPNYPRLDSGEVDWGK